MKYTAEKVQDYADACRLAHKGPVIADMLTELAERIKADEEAMPAYWAAIGEKEPDGSGGEIVLAYPADDGNDGEAARTECNQYINDAMLNERVRLRLVPLFTHPPAQAAQGETACPKRGVTNPEDAATRCCPDGDSCPGCEDPLAQAWDRKAAQPASGDWDAVRKVRDWLVARGKKLRDSEQYDYPIAQRRADNYDQQADKLTAALPRAAQNTAAEPAAQGEVLNLREAAEEALVLLEHLDPQHGITVQLRVVLAAQPRTVPDGMVLVPECVLSIKQAAIEANDKTREK